MDLGKLFSNGLKDNSGGLKQILILGALAVIVMGFGNGLPAINSSYNEQYGLEPDYGMEKQRYRDDHKKKKHKHHHHNKPEYIPADPPTMESENTAEENNTGSDEALNPSYATYTVE